MRPVSSVTGREIRTKRDMMSSETPMRDIASVADDSRNMSCAVPTQALENNDGMTSADVLQEAAASTLLQLHGREPSDTEQRGEHSLTANVSVTIFRRQ